MGSAIDFTTLEEAGSGGLNAPINRIDDLNDCQPVGNSPVSRWQLATGDGTLDFLMVNKRAGAPLVCSFHGALDRDKYALPRFERMASLVALDVNSVYFADPLLALDGKLQLAWFEGGRGSRLTQDIAAVVEHLKGRTSSRSTLLTGSSGGGFASLQIAPLIPGSVAVVFNPQTTIGGYLAGGTGHGAKRDYLRAVWPDEHAAIGGKVEVLDGPPGFESLTDPRTTVWHRYESPVACSIVYCNNRNDFHVADHYQPFADAIARGNNTSKMYVLEYPGGNGHMPPSPDQFKLGLTLGLGLATKEAS